jgi:hypothetical protein
LENRVNSQNTEVAALRTANKNLESFLFDSTQGIATIDNSISRLQKNWKAAKGDAATVSKKVQSLTEAVTEGRAQSRAINQSVVLLQGDVAGVLQAIRDLSTQVAALYQAQITQSSQDRTGTISSAPEVPILPPPDALTTRQQDLRRGNETRIQAALPSLQLSETQGLQDDNANRAQDRNRDSRGVSFNAQTTVVETSSGNGPIFHPPLLLMILIVIKILDAELVMKGSPTVANIADHTRRKGVKTNTARRISATAAIANVIFMTIQAAAMDLRPRRQIQTVAAPIMLILLDSSTAFRASAKDIVHHREINLVAHPLVVQHRDTNAQQSQLERAIVSFILPVMYLSLRSPWKILCFIHQGLVQQSILNQSASLSNTIRLTKTQDIAQVKRATYDEFERLRRDIDSIERQGVMTTN